MRVESGMLGYLKDKAKDVLGITGYQAGSEYDPARNYPRTRFERSFEGITGFAIQVVSPVTYREAVRINVREQGNTNLFTVLMVFGELGLAGILAGIAIRYPESIGALAGLKAIYNLAANVGYDMAEEQIKETNRA